MTMEDTATQAPASSSPSILLVASGVVVVLSLVWWFFVRGGSSSSSEKGASKAGKGGQSSHGGKKAKLEKRAEKGAAAPVSKAERVRTTEEIHMVTAIKEHREEVFKVDVSHDGNYLVTCSSDRTMRLWSLASIFEKNPRHLRVNLDLDHATCCRFAPESPAPGVYVIAAGMSASRCIHLYAVSDKKSKEGKSQSKLLKQFPVQHNSQILTIDYSSNMKYLLSVSEETEAKLWNKDGVVLATINTNQFKNFMGVFSPDSRFISIATFTSDNRLWEIVTDKAGEFVKVQKAIELTPNGHKTSVHCVSYSSDSKKIATCSKDATWKLWSIAVAYQLKEDPKCLVTSTSENSQPLDLIAIAPHGKLVAVTAKKGLYVYAENGVLSLSLPNAHQDQITSLVWLKDSKNVITSSRDKQVRLWRID